MSRTARPWTPCWKPYATTVAEKNVSRTICPIAPLVGTHFP